MVVDLERQGFDKDGQPGEKTRHEKVPIEIGASANPPGLDDELKGLSAGAQKTFRLRFPDDYSVAELAGTEVAYTRERARRAHARGATASTTSSRRTWASSRRSTR